MIRRATHGLGERKGEGPHAGCGEHVKAVRLPNEGAKTAQGRFKRALDTDSGLGKKNDY